jgi:integrase
MKDINNDNKLPRGVSIKKNKLSNSLQLSFTYKNIKCREIYPFRVTDRNIKKASDKVAGIRDRIESGTFNYADEFPTSSKLKIFSNITHDVNVKYYLDDYIENAVRRGLSHTTINSYRKSVAALKPLWNFSVGKLTAREVLSFIENSPQAPKTIRNRISVLRCSLNKAIIQNMITIDPTSQINLSVFLSNEKKLNARKKHKDVLPFNGEEIYNILNNCSGQEKYIITFCIETGCRSGEWAGLKWCDVNFDSKEVCLVETFTENQIKGTKSNLARTVPLSNKAIEALTSQFELTGTNGEFVFLNSKGNPWNTDSFRKHQWTKIIKKSGVKYRYPYQLRHSFATRNISEGMNLWKLSQLMGHRSPEMLLKHYGNFLDDYEKKKKK